LQAKQLSTPAGGSSTKQKLHIEEERILKDEAVKKVKELEAKFKRLDGKQLSEKQR
jgi:hypothetical protein